MPSRETTIIARWVKTGESGRPVTMELTDTGLLLGRIGKRTPHKIRHRGSAHRAATRWTLEEAGQRAAEYGFSSSPLTNATVSGMVHSSGNGEPRDGSHDNQEDITMSTTTHPAVDPVDGFAGASSDDDESPAVTPGSTVVKRGGKPDPKPSERASAGKPAASKPKTPEIEDGLYAALESAVKQLVKKPKPEFKVAPSGSYTTIRVDKRPIGYFHPPSRKGMAVHVTLTKAEASKLVKGIAFEAHQKGAVKARATVTTKAEATEIAKVIAAAATVEA